MLFLECHIHLSHAVQPPPPSRLVVGDFNIHIDIDVDAIRLCYVRGIYKVGSSEEEEEERRAVDRRDGGSIPLAAVSKHFVHLTLPVFFRRDPKNCWSFLSGVYARRNKRSHTGVNA